MKFLTPPSSSHTPSSHSPLSPRCRWIYNCVSGLQIWFINIIYFHHWYICVYKWYFGKIRQKQEYSRHRGNLAHNRAHLIVVTIKRVYKSCLFSAFNNLCSHQVCLNHVSLSLITMLWRRLLPVTHTYTKSTYCVPNLRVHSHLVCNLPGYVQYDARLWDHNLPWTSFIWDSHGILRIFSRVFQA